MIFEGAEDFKIYLFVEHYEVPVFISKVNHEDGRYEQTRSLRDVGFKRLFGVKRHTFEAMHKELRVAQRAKTKPGRPCKLNL